MLEWGGSCNYPSIRPIHWTGLFHARYCGSTIPGTMTSLSNTLTVQFISDASFAYNGFSADYTSENITKGE